MPGLGRSCGSGASGSGGSLQSSPMHLFSSTDFQQEGLETPRERTETQPTHALQTYVCETRGLQKQDRYRKGCLEGRGNGAVIPVIKVEVSGEWVVPLLIPELVLTQVPWGTFAALEQGTVGGILKNNNPIRVVTQCCSGATGTVYCSN